MRRIFMSMGAAVMLLALFAGEFEAMAEQPEQVGVTAVSRGETMLITDNMPRLAENGSEVFFNDVVRTSVGGSTQLLLKDETTFTVGPDASLTIDEFVFDPNTDDGTVAVNLIQGSFRYVSGRIGKAQPENVRLKLPVGTIGVRGTDLWVNIEPNGAVQIGLFGAGVNVDTGERVGGFIFTPNGGGAPTEVYRAGFMIEITQFGGDIDVSSPSRTGDTMMASLMGGLMGSSRPGAGNSDQGIASAAVESGFRASRLRKIAILVLYGQEDTGDAGVTEQDGRVLAANEDTLDPQVRLVTFDEIKSISTGTGQYALSGVNFFAGTRGPSLAAIQADPTLVFNHNTSGGSVGTADLQMNVNYATRTVDFLANNIAAPSLTGVPLTSAMANVSYNAQTGGFALQGTMAGIAAGVDADMRAFITGPFTGKPGSIKMDVIIVNGGTDVGVAAGDLPCVSGC